MLSWERALGSSVGGVFLRTPVIISSGVWPHDPSFWKSPHADGAGAICTKGLTLAPRKGNPGIRLWETPCGLLNSIGLENPGIESFLENDLPALKERNVSLIVNIWAESEKEASIIFERLSHFEKLIDAVELNISCPNVREVKLNESKAIIHKARSLWKKALWIKISPQLSDPIREAKTAEEEGADAVVVANSWLGLAIDNEKQKPVFKRIFAGLSGPAIFPLTLRLVWEISNVVSIPVIGCGGISSPEQAISMLLAGAYAVEIGSATFMTKDLHLRIAQGIFEYIREKKLSHYQEIVGRAKVEVKRK
ncbi:MAG: dihydroorotate dehydrogenase [Synergistetes bacterium]|nr:dihydroorotate dehydrogenase [Synergistota bacterium]